MRAAAEEDIGHISNLGASLGMEQKYSQKSHFEAFWVQAQEWAKGHFVKGSAAPNQTRL